MKHLSPTNNTSAIEERALQFYGNSIAKIVFTEKRQYTKKI